MLQSCLPCPSSAVALVPACMGGGRRCATMLRTRDLLGNGSSASAERLFNMGEKLMHAINTNPSFKMRLRWATPSEYLAEAYPSLLANSSPASAPSSSSAPPPLPTAPHQQQLTPPARPAIAEPASVSPAAVLDPSKARLQRVGMDMSEDSSGDALPYNDNLDVLGV